MTKSGGQPADALSRLEDMLTRTRRMCDLAAAGAWDEVIALEEERRQWMNRSVSPPDGFNDPQAAAHALREILALDEKIIAMGRAAQAELGGALGDLQRGRQATQAYREIES